MESESGRPLYLTPAPRPQRDMRANTPHSAAGDTALDINAIGLDDDIDASGVVPALVEDEAKDRPSKSKLSAPPIEGRHGTPKEDMFAVENAMDRRDIQSIDLYAELSGPDVSVICPQGKDSDIKPASRETTASADAQSSPHETSASIFSQAMEDLDSADAEEQVAETPSTSVSKSPVLPKESSEDSDIKLASSGQSPPVKKDWRFFAQQKLKSKEAPAVTTVCIDIEAHNMSDEQGAAEEKVEESTTENASAQ
jgi:hypothetical protein